jgi:hypothetical protein
MKLAYSIEEHDARDEPRLSLASATYITLTLVKAVCTATYITLTLGPVKALCTAKSITLPLVKAVCTATYITLTLVKAVCTAKSIVTIKSRCLQMTLRLLIRTHATGRAKGRK